MKKMIITISVLAVVGVLAFVVYKSFIAPKIPQSFIDKHNEIAAMGKEAEKISDLRDMPEITSLDRQISDSDFAKALKSIESGLGRKNEAALKLKSIDGKLGELEILSKKISNSEVKKITGEFVGLAKKENSIQIRYNDLQIQMLEKTKTMVAVLEKDKTAGTMSAADEKKIDELIKQIDEIKKQFSAAETEMENVQKQYKDMEKKFLEVANVSLDE